MTEIVPGSDTNRAQEELLVNVPLTVLGLSTIYSSVLGWLERRYPIKPDHTWAEVAGGVLITLVPVAYSARRYPDLNWRTYEAAVWRCFFASGVPIILWQLGEAVIRQVDLLNYAAQRDARSEIAHADDTPSLADRGGERAYRGAWSGERSDTDIAEGSGEA